VLAVGLLPWTPLLFARSLTKDPATGALARIVVFGLLFFSLSRNKLPGYVLPLLPALAAIIGVRLAMWPTHTCRRALAACAILLAIYPMTVEVLPTAVARGLSRSGLPAFHWTWLVPLGLAAAVYMLAQNGRTSTAVAAVAGGAVTGVVLIKLAVFPVLDAQVSARALWRTMEPCRNQVCVENLHRTLRYGLNYYSGEPLPDCAAHARPHRLAGEWMPRWQSCDGLTSIPKPL
jgi:hypothetical protein